MIDQQLSVILVSFCRPNRVARRCKPATTIPMVYRRLQMAPRNTSATRPFLLRSHQTWTPTQSALSFCSSCWPPSSSQPGCHGAGSARRGEPAGYLLNAGEPLSKNGKPSAFPEAKHARLVALFRHMLVKGGLPRLCGPPCSYFDGCCPAGGGGARGVSPPNQPPVQPSSARTMITAATTPAMTRLSMSRLPVCCESTATHHADDSSAT
jgi:hypothetical protein